MKKTLLVLLVFILCLPVACKKKEQKVYTGAVMLYSTLDNDILKTIKFGFENEYRGVTLDYYHSRDERVRQLIDNEKSTGEFDGDVLLGFDIDTFAELKEKEYFSEYKSKESKKIDAQYKDAEDMYVGAIKLQKESNEQIVVPVALLKNPINEENGKILIDYILSKKCAEALKEIGVETLRK